MNPSTMAGLLLLLLLLCCGSVLWTGDCGGVDAWTARGRLLV